MLNVSEKAPCWFLMLTHISKCSIDIPNDPIKYLDDPLNLIKSLYPNTSHLFFGWSIVISLLVEVMNYGGLVVPTLMSYVDWLPQVSPRKKM